MAYHQYTIRTPGRDALEQHFRDAGVGCTIFYPLCLCACTNRSASRPSVMPG
jgi:hypothetical protein